MKPPLYYSYDPVTTRATKITEDDDVGLVILHTQRTAEIIESNKRLASNFDKHRRNPDGITHVARIPMVEWQRIQRLGITKDEKAFNKYLNSRECRLFRTDDGRKL
jgi:hypothetical protein